MHLQKIDTHVDYTFLGENGQNTGQNLQNTKSRSTICFRRLRVPPRFPHGFSGARGRTFKSYRARHFVPAAYALCHSLNLPVSPAKLLLS